jgi:hypothetical protein
MMNVYYIGGSPCAGKSTVAELITQKYGLFYFKVDDFLEDYIIRGVQKNKPICRKLIELTPEQIWMRSPVEQNIEELQFYREIFEFIIEDINKIDSVKGIITEGAAFLPELIMKMNVDKEHYFCITPAEEFQIFHFKQRPFVPDVLKGCSDKELAFHNWMERDILFAQEVRRQCVREGYHSLITDGTLTIDETLKKVLMIFGMEE